MSELIRYELCRINDLSNGQMREFEIRTSSVNSTVLLIKQNNRFYAYGSKCCHYKLPLVKGLKNWFIFYYEKKIFWIDQEFYRVTIFVVFRMELVFELIQVISKIILVMDICQVSSRFLLNIYLIEFSFDIKNMKLKLLANKLF